MMDPGFGVLSKDGNGFGEIALCEVGEGDGFEDGAEVGADGDPDLLQGSAAPGYSTASGHSPRTLARGPSTARITSASGISSGGRASQ